MKKQFKLNLDKPKKVSLTLNLSVDLVKRLRAFAAANPEMPIPVTRVGEVALTRGLLLIEQEVAAGAQK